MKKYLLLIILSVICFQDIYATHTKGGWMYYEYLGPGINDPTKLRYRIGLNYYVSCISSVPEPNWNFTFFRGTAPYTFLQDIPITPLSTVQILGCTSTNCYPCLSSVPDRCYSIRNYEIIVELDPSPDGYVISKQRCCRVGTITNLINPDSFGATYTIRIPGFSDGPTAPMNSSPKFIFNDTAVVCGDYQFSINFNATDIDGDSLVYSFIDAYHGGDNGVNSNPVTAAPPPYSNVLYAPPYSGTQPLGSLVSIDPVTGLITGIAPPTGEYVICVLVKEYRNGIYIGETRKELHLKTAPCNPLTAVPDFVPITCDGFTVNFNQLSTGNPNTFFWDFGDPASGANNTSNLPNPVHTFSDTGVFNIKLVVSISGQCTDSITKPISVYPGFLPGFINSTPCVNVPIQFTDTTYTAYGVVNSWRWDFGDPSTLADTSHLQNPVYTYTSPGIYNVELRVTNSKGCNKIYVLPITIFDNPALSIFPRDSVYCGLDTLQLTGVGAGAFNWTPPINIIGANTATPRVFPTATTQYKARLTDVNGCITNDSLTVIPKFDLTNGITGPISICEEDTVVLRGSSNYSNGITWQWTPVISVESPVNDTTRVYPVVNTTYTLRTRWGNNCIATKTHTINVTPLANANAGPDAFVCSSGNQSTTQLNASGGISYSWTPVAGLSNPNIPNPVASPAVPTYYVVAVGVAGCPKLRTDTVFVDVGDPPVFNTINDTLICTIDTLQLATNGTGNYLWSPNYMISSTTAQSPLVSPDVPTWYHVSLTDAVGCRSLDSVFIDVKASVTLNAGADTTICQTDAIRLNTVSDGLYYQWTPSTYLDFDNIKNPVATPLTTTTYTVVSSIGKCSNQDDITITVVPYPVANAGPDEAICSGFNVQLNATGGSSYAWSPATFLTGTQIPNPVSVRPTASIRYIVTVRDNLGCPKPVKDTVWVTVHPPVIADAGPRDTSVVKGEPLFLQATGGDNYVWTPSTWLNNPNISNPIALVQDNIEYLVTVTTNDGCVGTDRIMVHLYNVDPDMYVPTAFTPNNDGNNDVLRPILLGMRGLNYFRVYNRWGVLLFSTTENGKGWDGRYNGKAQDPATYVWMAEGVTFDGKLKKKKGYAVLIR